MRHNLVFHLRCSQCAGNLRLTYDSPKVSEPYQPEADDKITGAAKVEKNLYVEPCPICYGEATAPLIALREALGVKP